MSKPDQDTRERLLMEREAGQNAERAYNAIIKPFYDAKLWELFEAFCQAPIGDTENLVNIHHMFKSLEALHHSTAEAIETGKMAEYSLRELEARAKADKVI